MQILKADPRDTKLKPKQLRREGMIPGVLYGKSLEASLSIQFSQADAVRFLRSGTVGSRAELAVGDRKYPALLREVTYKPATRDLEHLSFQALVADEVITSIAHLILLNREKVAGMVQQPQNDISYRALPAHLFDRIEIDLEGKTTGDSMRVGDLDIADNPDIEILTPLDAMVFAISDPRAIATTTDVDTDEEGEVETDAAAPVSESE